MAKDLTVRLPDRPGTLADLGEALGGAGINIAGAAGMAAGGQADIHLLVHDPAAARRAVEQAGFQVTNERDVVVADIADKPGALGKAARRMAEANVNIDILYLTAAGRLVLGVDDVEKARSAL